MRVLERLIIFAMVGLFVACVSSGAQVIVPAQVPTITSLSASTGAIGSILTVTGSGFGSSADAISVSYVTMNGVRATWSAWSDTSITLTVPTTTSGPVLVTRGSRVSNGMTFTIGSSGSAQTCLGTTYYIRTDGSNSNNGKSNSAGGAFLTITKGAQTAVGGDCVRVQAGTYAETTSAFASGTSGNTVTFVADGSVTTCHLTVSGKSYIRFIGFTIDPTATGCSSGVGVTGGGTSTGLEFWNVTIQNTNASKAIVFDIGAGSTNRCDKCIWFGGAVANAGAVGSSIVAFLSSGDDDFIGYMNFTNICYVGIGPAGTRGRFQNNNFSGLTNCGGGAHPDNFYIATNATEGWTFNVVESVFNIGTNTLANNKFHHQQNSNAPVWSDNVYRFNVSYQLGGGVMSLYNDPGAGGNERTRDYNNTWVQPERAQSVTGCQTIGSGATTSLYDYNDLFYQCQSAGLTSGITIWAFGSGTSTANLFHDYNLSFDPAGPDTFGTPYSTELHRQANVDPKLNNVVGNDFTIGATSGARGNGGPITTATSCLGTTLNVALNTGSSFIPDDSANLTQYGGKLMPGDFLTIDGTTYQVSALSGDALTLNASVTCSNGDAVYFGSSSTIDIGAYPYKSGGYTLSATKSIAGSTVTVTPNDVSLVRFMICYEANVPYAVVNAAPYTCANPTGTLGAYVYPRYASQTQSVVAN